MPSPMQAIRGMHDILMEESPTWRFVEQQINAILMQYGYQEIRLPILEKTAVFSRTLGEQTDIVSKEMYSFIDHNGHSLTLRPEGTASCVRAGIEHGLFHNQVQRLWYLGPMFRHERPQKGRQRQFHQLGIEAYGFPGPDIDAEILLICQRIWRRLGLDKLRLELNSLGDHETRNRYRHSLTQYFTAHRDQLDQDSLRRLAHHNPLRILDSKNVAMQDLIEHAPNIMEYLDSESMQHLSQLREFLEAHEIPYTINPKLVRGLDYYNKTIFEWISHELGAQATVCAGGRYDALTQQLGGKATPAIGCALGLERLIELTNKTNYQTKYAPHVYFIVGGEPAFKAALKLCESLRNKLPALHILLHCGGGSLKSQFKMADKSGAGLALILGENELSCQQVGLKQLRQQQEQSQIAWEDLAGRLKDLLVHAPSSQAQ